ncbi:MAG: response regulator transcription factor [Actinomycetia bacterium]|nr:response regulator transcription factor [Actinomycetes bacterium]
MTKDKLRVVVIDDHNVVRAGLRALFDGDEHLEVVGEASTAEEAIRRVGLETPDVAVLDVRLPDSSGLDVCRKIRAGWPNTQVLILTSYADNDALIEAFDAGAAGYVLKRVDADGLIDAVIRAGRGERMFGEALDAALANRIRSGGDPGDGLSVLSLQERKVLDLIAQGMSNKQIAAEMFLSDKTVKNYVSHILTKLEMSSRTEAAAFAVEQAARRSMRYPAEEWSTTSRDH